MTDVRSDDVDRAASDRPAHLSDATDLEAFVSTHGLALVEFYTEGCGVCASMEPVLGIVARAGEATVGLINPRDDPSLVEAYDVRSVPTFVLFGHGQPVARLADGFVGAETLLAFVADHADGYSASASSEVCDR